MAFIKKASPEEFKIYRQRERLTRTGIKNLSIGDRVICMSQSRATGGEEKSIYSIDSFEDSYPLIVEGREYIQGHASHYCLYEELGTKDDNLLDRLIGG